MYKAICQGCWGIVALDIFGQGAFHRYLLRINRGQTDRQHITQYFNQAKQTLVYDIAAQAWAWGLPWSEALPIARKAAQAGSPKAKAWPKVKAKAKCRAKAKASARP